MILQVNRVPLALSASYAKLHKRKKWYTRFRVEAKMGSGRNIVVRDPEILGGTPIFRGTRVPLQALFDSLEGGETLEEFLEGFPGVTREMAIAALEEAQHLLSSKS